MSIAETFGKRITILREEQGMSREDLSKKINLPEKTIIKLESGKRNPTIPEVVVLGRFFNVSYDYILGQSKDRIAQEFVDKAGGDELLASILQRVSSLSEEEADALLQRLLEMDQLSHQKAMHEKDTQTLEE